jgi:hypothetical protein
MYSINNNEEDTFLEYLICNSIQLGFVGFKNYNEITQLVPQCSEVHRKLKEKFDNDFFDKSAPRGVYYPTLLKNCLIFCNCNN